MILEICNPEYDISSPHNTNTMPCHQLLNTKGMPLWTASSKPFQDGWEENTSYAVEIWKLLKILHTFLHIWHI